VQEVQQRCPDTDPAYRKLVDTTREIVEDEVGTLRRLVTEFSSFARLPQAQLEQSDLRDFLQSLQRRFEAYDEEDGALDTVAARLSPVGNLKVTLELPDKPALSHLDAQMLGRALLNLVRNAMQATLAKGQGEGRVVIRLTQDDDYWVIDVDDNGPGIPPSIRDSVFDPYVTTKTDGTGLGLAITKKIVVEHGGTISAETSPMGGARLEVRLPVAGTAAAAMALEAASEVSSPASSPRGSREK